MLRSQRKYAKKKKKSAYGARCAHSPLVITAMVHGLASCCERYAFFPPNAPFLYYVSPDDFQTVKADERTKIVKRVYLLTSSTTYTFSSSHPDFI